METVPRASACDARSLVIARATTTRPEWAGLRQVMATRTVISGRGTYDRARPSVQTTCGHHRLTVHLFDASS